MMSTMYHVASLQGAHWYGAKLDRTLIKRESLGQRIGDEIEAHEKKGAEAYHNAKEAYFLLKRNFNSIGRYKDAAWAYIKEQQMEKMACHWEWRSQGWRLWCAWPARWRWLGSWAYESLTGYGERPLNPVIGGGLIILGFALAFWLTRALGSFGDALMYSLATFATFNLARPELNPEGAGIEAATSVEALLSIGVLALFVFTLGNRMSRG